MVEVIRFNGPLSLAMHLIGQRGIAQPPAPPIARTDMQTHFSGDAARRARQTEQKGDQNPVRERPLTLMEHGVREIVKGALVAVTPGAFTSWSVVVIAPRIDVVAVAPGTWQRAIFPPQRMDVGLAGVGTEKLVYMGENRHQ